MVKKIVHIVSEMSHTESFKALYNSHFAILCLYACRFIPDRDICMDIVQESYIKLWNELPRYNSRITRLRFLYTAVRNAALNAIRHEQVRQRVHSGKYIDITLEHDIFENEVQGMLLRAIQALPARHSQVILLELQGYSITEIAALQGKSLQTVKNTRVLAIKKLKNKIGRFMQVRPN